MTNRYIDQVRSEIDLFDPHGTNKYFLFGSSVRAETFHDIDVGVVGNSTSKKSLSALRERFYDSSIPYRVDIVDFDGADDDFKKYVFDNEPLVWIR